MKQKFLIIGAGRFGSSLIKELYTFGHEVVACDQNEELLENIDEFTNHTIIGDATDDALLDELNIQEYQAVIVAIGTNFQSAAYVVGKVKEKGCQMVITKALDFFSGKLLKQIGADKVIYPETEAGVRLARQLSNPGLLQFIELAPNVSGIELEVPESFVGKDLANLDFRRKYKSTVVMISRKSEKHPIITPMADVVFEEGDIIFVVGENDALEKLKRKLAL